MTDREAYIGVFRISKDPKLLYAPKWHLLQGAFVHGRPAWRRLFALIRDHYSYGFVCPQRASIVNIRIHADCPDIEFVITVKAPYDAAVIATELDSHGLIIRPTHSFSLISPFRALTPHS